MGFFEFEFLCGFFILIDLIPSKNVASSIQLTSSIDTITLFCYCPLSQVGILLEKSSAGL